MRRTVGLALATSIAMNLSPGCYHRGSRGQLIIFILASWLIVSFVLAASMFVVARISPARQQPSIGAVDD